MALPKLSEMLKLFQTPEAQFEDMVRSTLGIEIPPGPSTSIASIMETFEELVPLPSPETFGFPQLPQLPGFPLLFGEGKEESKQEQAPKEVPKKESKPQARPTAQVKRPRVRRGLVY